MAGRHGMELPRTCVACALSVFPLRSLWSAARALCHTRPFARATVLACCMLLAARLHCLLVVARDVMP